MHEDQGLVRHFLSRNWSDTFCRGKSCDFLEMAMHEPATLVKLHAEFKWVITPLVSVPSSVAAEPHSRLEARGQGHRWCVARRMRSVLFPPSWCRGGLVVKSSHPESRCEAMCDGRPCEALAPSDIRARSRGHCAQLAALHWTAQGVNGSARATQARADGTAESVLESMRQTSRAALHRGSVLSLIGFGLAVRGGLSVLLSTVKREPGWRLLAGAVLMAYVLVGLVMV
jgi:hypothetical protein